MNNIKIGDSLLCKEDFYNKEELIFKKDKCYQINDIEDIYIRTDEASTVVIKLDSTRLWYKHIRITENHIKKWYVWTYFYTPAELRQKQIDSIIDGNI